MAEVILKCDSASFEDKELREYVKSLETRIVTLQERTLRHTIDIRELRKKIKLIMK